MKKTKKPTIKQQAAQGDVLFRRVEAIPPDAPEQPRTGESIVVAHSETGHHHVVHAERVRLFGAESSLVAYLLVEEPSIDVEHMRPWDTHAPVTLPKGKWEIRRQREWVPEGWRRVAD